MRSLLFILLLIHACCCAARVPLSRNIWLNEANAALKVNCFLLDSAQCMWLGTENGLFTYNGKEARPVSDQNREAITSVALHKGNLVYGTDKGMVYTYHAGRRKPLLEAKAAVSTIEVLPYGMMIGTLGDGGYFISGSRSYHFSKENVLPDDYVYRIFSIANNIYIATDLGLFMLRHLDSGQLASQRVDFPADITRVVCQANKDGGAWAGFQEKGIGYLRPEGGSDSSSRLLLCDTPWRWGQVNDIYPFSSEAAWVATEAGILLRAAIQDGQLHVDTIVSIGTAINRLLPDRSGNLWMATAAGLTQVTVNYLGLIPLGGNYSLAQVTALTTDTSGGVWYTQEQDLFFYNLKTSGSRMVLQAPSIITCLFNDDRNRLWIGTSAHGLLSRGADGSLQTYDIPDVTGSHVLSLTGADGKVWLSGLNGIVEMNTDHEGQVSAVRHHHKREGIGSDYVYRIFIDSRKRTWFATDGAGIAMNDGQRYHHWGVQEGFDSKVVYSITEDSAGRIWAGTLDQGAYMYDGQRWKHYTRFDGLQDETITGLAANAVGHVVLLTARGIDIWYPGSRSFRNLNRRSRLGLDSNSSDVLNLAATGRNQEIYLPVQQGLLVYTVAGFPADIRPSVHIDGISLFLRPLEEERHHFDHDENYLSFHFNGNNFAHSGPLFFRYSLEGLSREWVMTTDEVISFPRLQPGHYRLVVQASLSRSFDHPAIAAYAFEIARPFWREWWFIGLAVLATGLLLYWLVQRRVRALQKLALLKEERMAFEYEYLKSQVNPHFLFNSLNTLVTLIEESPDSAVNYTEHLSDLYRETLSVHGDDLVLLAYEWTILDKYCYIQQTRFGAALQVVSSVPDIEKESRRIIPLALQLLVENAIKHNVVSKRDPLIIFIDIAADYLVVRNRIHRKMTPEKSSGIGLRNIVKRYALVTDKKVRIETDGPEFIVALPLL